MPTRFVVRPLCFAGSLAIAFLLASERPSEARPIYKKAFDFVYKDVLKSNRVTCAVCHSGDDKKHLNHYGKAIAEELGEKNVRDFDKIVAAIRAVAKRKCKSGVWQERLEKGLPPCDCVDQNAGSYIALQLARERHEDR